MVQDIKSVLSCVMSNVSQHALNMFKSGGIHLRGNVIPFVVAGNATITFYNLRDTN